MGQREGQSGKAAGEDVIGRAERGQKNEVKKTDAHLGAIKRGVEGLSSDSLIDESQAFGRVKVKVGERTHHGRGSTDWNKNSGAAVDSSTSSSAHRLGWSWMRAGEGKGEGEKASGRGRGQSARDLSYRGKAAVHDVHNWLGGRGSGEGGEGGERNERDGQWRESSRAVSGGKRRAVCLPCHRGSVTGIGLSWHEETSDVLAVTVGTDGCVKVRGDETRRMRQGERGRDETDASR